MMARRDKGKWLSWKYLVPRYSSFPSRAGALPEAWWLSSAGGNNLLMREFTVEGNKERGVVRLRQLNAFLINWT